MACSDWMLIIVTWSGIIRQQYNKLESKKISAPKENRPPQWQAAYSVLLGPDHSN